MLKTKWTGFQRGIAVEKSWPLSGRGKDMLESRMILAADVRNHNKETQSVSESEGVGDVPAGISYPYDLG